MSEAVGRLIVDLTTEGSEARLQALQSNLEEFGGVVDNLKGSFDALWAANEKFVEFIERGGQVSDVMGALTTDISTARKQIQGMATDLDLAKVANAATQAGFQLTGEQLGAVAVAARKVSDATGAELIPTMERLMGGIIRGNDRALRPFGIHLEGITDRGQKSQAALEQLTKKFAGVSAGADDAADQIQRFKVWWDNLLDAIARGVAEDGPLQDTIGAFTDVAQALTDMTTEIPMAVDQLRFLKEAVMMTASPILALGRGIHAITTAFRELQRVTRGGSQGTARGEGIEGLSDEELAAQEMAIYLAGTEGGLSDGRMSAGGQMTRGMGGNEEGRLVGRDPQRGGSGGSRKGASKATEAGLQDYLDREAALLEAHQERMKQIAIEGQDAIFDAREAAFRAQQEQGKEAARFQEQQAREELLRIKRNIQKKEEWAEREAQLNDQRIAAAQAGASAAADVFQQVAVALGASESTQMIIIGLKEAVEAVAAVARYDYVSAGLHTVASALAFVNAAKAESAAGSSGGKSAGGGGGGGGGGFGPGVSASRSRGPDFGGSSGGNFDMGGNSGGGSIVIMAAGGVVEDGQLRLAARRLSEMKRRGYF